MYELKTKKSDASVEKFIASVKSDEKRADCKTLHELMRDVTGEEAAMWGGSIIGYGAYSYKYESGHAGELCLTAFSPRKQYLSIYIMDGFEHYGDLMARLGKHKTGKSCLYVKRLSEIDLDVLRELVSRSFAAMKENNLA